MNQATNERLLNLRRHLSFCGNSPIDVILRSQITAEITDILNGKETVALRQEPTNAETRLVDNDAWLEDARRRLERL